MLVPLREIKTSGSYSPTQEGSRVSIPRRVIKTVERVQGKSLPSPGFNSTEGDKNFKLYGGRDRNSKVSIPHRVIKTYTKDYLYLLKRLCFNSTQGDKNPLTAPK